ncbi:MULTISPECIES: helix-turn-helix domain-containing protein [unclassified Clostridioides]|uniref:helix-turn-helix domain-containing protein n=1 Tax=unclassified Clostridioides TaxID=2635829 RepID=UPI001D10951C|nr:helix-turn-helix transcriptional regulator [Clostridioides sp. ZZV14-6105]MCC0723125.1 helix-turn-helix transcriptional regulator [Clostridioides sp. ZZV14-6104]MCC0727263.1 helix-turn-helix transcriptional regulator [Clostridioides sp. ZZV14-6045]MCC0730985.1 helix-turn-helix transcriptional regulator [Clostridioides sp. ZZV14-6048]MCC0739083.1 helix-turn-helix transcriptional regulator [Clostridioides sp. ZZV14-5902]MCC0742947.1 helix-turn-helix transcriptional regulator [Clostridioides s
MNFGEKLFKLRKEKGLSQEAIAEQIGTTRQAVSKWENNQGFPETEKLLLLSNIFEVSIDFLLKDEKSIKGTNEKGYYVSKEVARGYLINEKRECKYLGLCFLFWALAGIPYVMLPTHTSWRILGIAVCVVLGIGVVILGMFTEQEDYEILRKEPLLFDYEFLKELSKEYISIKKKYKLVAIPSTFLFVVGILIIAVTARGYIEWTEYHSLVFLGLAVGIFGFVQSIGIMDAYELLVKNEQYCDRFIFKVKRQLKNKIDRF